MKHKRATLNAQCGERATLRTSANTALDVDLESGVIRGAAVMSVGPAEGWGWNIDHTTLEQVHRLMLAAGQTPSRFKHQGMNADGTPMSAAPEALGSKVAMLSNPRIDGDILRADVKVGSYAENVPGLGNVRAYLLNLAKDAPTELGLSVDFFYTIEQRGGLAFARAQSINSIDFVDNPAANRRGLLAVASPSVSDAGALPVVDPLHSMKGVLMDPKLLELLVSMGLDPSSTPEQAQAFCAALPSDKQRAVCSAFPDFMPKAEAAPAEPAKPAQMAARPAAPKVQSVDATDRAVLAAETARVKGIREVAELYGHDAAWADEQIGGGADVATAQRAALSALAAKHQALPVQVRDERNVSSLPVAISDAIRLRAGLAVATPHERSREFRGLSMSEMARAYLQAINIDTRGMGRNEVCQLVFNRARLAQLGRAALAQTPGDFSNILADTIGKTLRQAYEEYPATWQQWVRRTTAPDFKTITRTQLSEGPNLRRVRKGGEYPDLALSDSKETYTLNKYGGILTLSWETLTNDDLNAFSRVPEVMGRAARRLENDLAYYVLLANATMQDTGALFNSTAVTTAGGHANLASSGTITAANLNTAVAAMMVQKGLNNGVLGIVPTYIIVPPAIGGTAWQVMNSIADPASSNANVKNRFAQGGQYPLTVIVEPALQNGVTIQDGEGTSILSANGSSTAWFLSASNAMIDTVELCFLEEEPAPVITEQDGFRTDGRQYKIRHTVAGAAIDWRGMYKSAGT